MVGEGAAYTGSFVPHVEKEMSIEVICAALLLQRLVWVFVCVSENYVQFTQQFRHTDRVGAAICQSFHGHEWFLMCNIQANQKQ